MKKLLLSPLFATFLAFSLLTCTSYADCSKCDSVKNDCECQKQIEKSPCDIEQTCKKADKSLLDDDEYCTYNQCFFDREFIKLKQALCLTSKQETCIDTLYKSYKSDLEVYHSRYRTQKNKLLEMIECGNDCYKDQINVLKELKKDVKERSKTFKNDIKEVLCKDQNRELKKFCRHEKKKMKKIFKYSCIYKLPCSDCHTK